MFALVLSESHVPPHAICGGTAFEASSVSNGTLHTAFEVHSVTFWVDLFSCRLLERQQKAKEQKASTPEDEEGRAERSIS